MASLKLAKTVVAIIVAGATLAGVAEAQNVPLPLPAPPRNQAPAQPRPSAPIPLTPGAVPTPQTDVARTPTIRPPAQFKPGETTALDAKQRALVDRISVYLTSLRILSGDFVQVVLRDKKASTSYIQRRLQIGYNRAASIMERMEQEGIVGQANHAGKREILALQEEHQSY